MAERSPKIRPAWQQYLPFVAVPLLRSVLILPLLPGWWTPGDAWDAFYHFSGFVLLGAASYLAARWSGRKRPPLSAFLAAAAGTSIAIATPGSLLPLDIVIPALIAIRPPSPLAYPMRLGLGTLFGGMTFAGSSVSALGLVTLVAPLFGVWLADRMTERALDGPAGVGRTGARVVIGVLSGATLGVLVGAAAAFVLMLWVSVVSEPSTGAEGDDLGLVVFGIVFWAGVLGTGIGLLGGLLSAARTPVGADA
jgi:hypothetical protein